MAYKAPGFAQIIRVKVLQPADETVGNSNIVPIVLEVIESDVDGKGRGQEET